MKTSRTVSGIYHSISSLKFKASIIEFEKSYRSLDISVSPKVHCVFQHVTEFLTLSQLGFKRIPGKMSDLSNMDLLDGFDVDGVRSCIESSQYSHGISRQELYNALRGQMVQRKVDEGLDLLASEGYIYTTMDHDHFRHIEA